MFSIYLIAALIGVPICVSIYYSIKRRKRIFALWDSHSKLDYKVNYHKSYKNFYNNSKKNAEDAYCIDQITWNDLNLTKVFEKINYTFTSVGEELLFYRLKKAHLLHSFDENLIERINQDKEYRIRLSLILSKLGKSPISDSSKYIFDKPYYKVKKMYFLLGFLPIAGILTLAVSISAGLLIILCSSLLNSFLFYITRSKHEMEFENLYYCLNVILTSRKLAKLNHDSAFLKQTAKLSIAPYISVMLLKDDDPTGSNLVLQFFTLLKSIFLVDYFAFHYIINFISSNRVTYEAAWRKIGEIDCSYSIALWRKTLPFYSLPKFSNKGTLDVNGAYHPLLKNPISNDFHFDGNILLTGSNASGKSTFIKTIAINIILSQALNTSTSRDITLTRGLVYSSMAMSDDIEKGQSYFLSEISALKRIFDIRDTNKESFMYLFIDEIFKGTNTVERIAAAESVLNYLENYHQTKIMAATHDLELTEKLSTKYENYHFREQIIDDEIIFDYLIKSGPSNTKNAIELLRITNFPEKVYRDAIHNSQEFLGVIKANTF